MEPQGIIHRRISELVPYARNSRTHSQTQISAIKALIVEFGFTNPILADATGIIAGHGRVLAARELYAAGERIYPAPGKAAGAQPLPADMLPTLDCTGWTDAQRRAYIIADNQVAMQAGWDTELLAIELESLQADGMDLQLLGFDDEDLQIFMADPKTVGKTDPDDAPPIPADPITRLGDIWVLGRHRIICGDCTNKEVVTQVLDGATPHLMVTDPPYGVDYDPAWRSEVNGDGVKSGRALGVVLNDDRSDWTEAWRLFDGDVAYVWCAGVFASAVSESLEKVGFDIRALIVWAKNKHTFGRGHYHHMHEPCWYAVRDSKTAHWSGDRKQTTLWAIDSNRNNETGHSTQKPVECMRRPIENHSVPGDLVYEPFSGSGTTIIAAEMTARTCYAIELSPAYVDVCVTRWQAYTGKKATRLSDGVEFDSIKPSVATQ